MTVETSRFGVLGRDAKAFGRIVRMALGLLIFAVVSLGALATVLVRAAWKIGVVGRLGA